MEMRLILTNNLTNREWRYSVTDSGGNAMYWHFPSLQLADDMPDGEYTYTLQDETGETYSRGLARIGDYTPEVTQPADNNEFIQYRGR